MAWTEQPADREAPPATVEQPCNHKPPAPQRTTEDCAVEGLCGVSGGVACCWPQQYRRHLLTTIRGPSQTEIARALGERGIKKLRCGECVRMGPSSPTCR